MKKTTLLTIGGLILAGVGSLLSDKAKEVDRNEEIKKQVDIAFAEHSAQEEET